VSTTGKQKPKELVFSTQRACPSCHRSFEELDPRLFSYNSKHGWCPRCYGTGLEMEGFDEEQSGEEIWWNEFWEEEEHICSACHGQRLNPVALAVRFRKRSIAEYTALPIEKADKAFRALKLNDREKQIARDILTEISTRLNFLQEVGLAYLNLDRSAPTLSGGEAQRIRLAAQLGSNLQGVCYILDEPTIGLHPRDNQMLLNTLRNLEGKGNTIVVVEHDEDTIRRAEHIIDLGPGAGINGGKVVVQGTVNTVTRCKQSLTGRFLAKPLTHPLVEQRQTVLRGKQATPVLHVTGARLNNLKNLSVKVPLQRFVGVTGVSGSGKSTLVREVIHENMAKLTKRKRKTSRKLAFYGCDNIAGWENIQRVLEVDQTPIGKTPRSCPATYIGFWNDIRKLFAQATESKIRGYTQSRFSFNVKGGRCEACEGQGMKKIEMSFLPNVKVPCEVCRGKRFNAETLSVLYKDKSIGDVLNMNVEQATEFFSAHSTIHNALQLLQDVGLGYLTLGQPSPTLSGGEAQRIKLVTELAKAGPQRARLQGKTVKTINKHTLYILDEPTIGLHMADVDKLIHVLHRLVDAGNTVIIIEHNLDIVAEADWLIDLGPEGGDAGGRIVAQGTPDAIIKRKGKSHTAAVLKQFLAQRTKLS
jgi:excinuclease ABC subunit A